MVDHQAQSRADTRPGDAQAGQQGRWFRQIETMRDAFPDEFGPIVGQDLLNLLESLRDTSPELLRARNIASDQMHRREVSTAQAWVEIVLASGLREDFDLACSEIKTLPSGKQWSLWKELMRGSKHFAPQVLNTALDAHLLDRDRITADEVLDLRLTLLECCQDPAVFGQVQRIMPGLEVAPKTLSFFARWHAITGHEGYREVFMEQLEAEKPAQQASWAIELFSATARLDDFELASDLILKVPRVSHDDLYTRLALVASEKHGLRFRVMSDEAGVEPSILAPRDGYEHVSALPLVIKSMENRVCVQASLLGATRRKRQLRPVLRSITQLEQEDRLRVPEAQMQLAVGCAQAGLIQKARLSAQRIGGLRPLRQVRANAAIAKAWLANRAEEKAEA